MPARTSPSGTALRWKDRSAIPLSPPLGHNRNLHIARPTHQAIQHAAMHALRPSFGMAPSYENVRGVLRARELHHAGGHVLALDDFRPDAQIAGKAQVPLDGLAVLLRKVGQRGIRADVY